MTNASDVLLGMSDDEFRAFVDRDLRKDSREQMDPAYREALRSPEVVERWLSFLIRMSKSVEGTLASRHEDHEAQKAALRASPGDKHIRLLSLSADYHKRRGSTLRFKAGLDEWIIEARTTRDSYRDDAFGVLSRVVQLEAAIASHRSTSEDEGLEPEPNDLELWAILTG